MGPEEKRSYEKFNYALRPSKQLERKLFIEAFHRLSKAGYSIPKYTYVGLGSVFYIDFILFHKYLYIDDMICVEKAAIPKRMKFNKPFRFIKIRMMPVSEVLSRLNARKKYLVWLDYDCALTGEVLQDVGAFARFLAPGCILIVTVEAQPERVELGENSADGWESANHLQQTLLKYQTEFGKYIPSPLKKTDLSKNGLAKLFAGILRSVIQDRVVARGNLAFLQLFNLKYADGAQMLTIGGVIEDPTKVKALVKLRVLDVPGMSDGPDPLQITVPPLTAPERHWLNQHLDEGLTLEDLDFELEDEALLQNYIRFYRHYPAYHEAFF